jgi:Holliday junction DNA helicase RuvA
MIAALRGTLLSKSPVEVVIDVGGVGYRVQVPVSTFCRLGDDGSAVSLFVHTHVREDQISLFGFSSRTEKTLFERLLAVSGVGPRIALSILSGIEADELVRALTTSDIARLTRVPGVGKKTAERLALELKDKLRDLAQPAESPSSADTGTADLVSALLNLGYSTAEAEKAAGKAQQSLPQGTVGERLRAALRELSSR